MTPDTELGIDLVGVDRLRDARLNYRHNGGHDGERQRDQMSPMHVVHRDRYRRAPPDR
jgi:hypothetical protein